jgi:uncharacterized membrane protein YpjA
MKKYLKNILYGFLVWLIPFVISIFFFSKEGGLTIDVFLFKTIMIVVGSISVAFLLVFYFKHIMTNYVKEGIIVGIVWFAVNILLDIIILIPMTGMSIADYFPQIGLRYLVMPVMSIVVGVVLTNKKQ